uniref:glycosyltransferase family 2 protein n=1 Tax=Comamonas testosteroni TaxID=285 RepID=UPI0015F9FA3D|nr:glycosyltransferase [Comamonas testosteroni]
MNPVPICLVAHRRPALTAFCLAALADCPEARDSELHVFVDGPRDKGEALLTQQVAALCRTARGFAAVHVAEREWNAGMAQAVVAAIDTMLAKYECAIVVEDDLLVAPGFLTFMNRGLQAYGGDAEVMGISGYVMQDLRGSLGERAVFSRRAACWGWAVWARSWRRLDRSRERLLERIASTGLAAFLDPEGGMSMTNRLRQGVLGQDNSWSPMWFASVALADGLFLYPPVSLVNNIGFDGDGTHKLATSAYDVALHDRDADFLLPLEVKEHPVIDALFVEAYRKSHLQRLKDEKVAAHGPM